ncbi:O-antigen ligase family protein [Sutcliffiella cohnii]
MHINDFIQEKKSYYLTLLLTIILLIFSNVVQGVIYLGIGIVIFGLIYVINISKGSKEFVISRMLVLSIPLSFTSVFGQSSGESNITWFNIFFFLLLVIYLFQILLTRKLSMNILSVVSIFLIIISLIPLLVSLNLIDGLKQYINLSMALLIILIGTSIKYRFNQNQKEQLMLDYISSAKIAAVGVIVQIAYINIIGNEVGYYSFMGGYRHAYGFLFSDFSFLSLFIASGAMMVYFVKSKYAKLNIFWIFEMSFLLLASLATSARTGITAFSIIFVVYSLFKFIHLLSKGSIKVLYIMLLNLIILVGSYLVFIRVRQGVGFSGSGRENLNDIAFSVFLENPLLGIGFGRENYNILVGMMPHNILFQSLAQGGLIYTIPLLIFLLLTLLLCYKYDRKLLPVFACVLVGSLFIPNIFNSRFFPVLLFLLSIKIQIKPLNIIKKHRMIS